MLPGLTMSTLTVSESSDRAYHLQIYSDNGKDYRCLECAGGRRMIKGVDERKTRSLLTTLELHALLSRQYFPKQTGLNVSLLAIHGRD